jgi:Phage integrase family
MGDIKVTVPRLRRISGRYYWRPTEAVRALGFANVPLGGDLLTAVAEAQRLNAEVERARLGADEWPSPRRGSVAHVIKIYRTDDAFTRLRKKTRNGYEKILREIERVAGGIMVEQITRKGLKATYKALKPRGLHIAAAHMRVWSILMGVALDEGLRKPEFGNPARKLKITTPPARNRRPTFDEVKRFCEVAEQEGRPSMKLAVLLAFELNQREGDVLALARSSYDGIRITVRQSKAGALVRVLATQVLKAALDDLDHHHATIVISEATGLPYKEDHFRHEFRRIADLAGLDFQFRDLRRGGLTEIGDAGATLLQLHATSGHKSLQSSEPYLVPTTAQADEAIRLREQMRKVSGKTGSARSGKDFGDGS